MNIEQQIAAIEEQVCSDPNSGKLREQYAQQLVPIVLQHWPSGEQAHDLDYYRAFLNRIAIPVGRIIENVTAHFVAEFFFKIYAGLSHVGEPLLAEDYALRGA